MGSNAALSAEWLDHSRQLGVKLGELRAKIQALCRAADQLSAGPALRPLQTEPRLFCARLRQAARERCERARQLCSKSEQLCASGAKLLEEARALSGARSHASPCCATPDGAG